MLKKQFCFKFLIFSLAITFYQTEAIGPNCQTGLECQTTGQVFQSPSADEIKFCRAELEKSFATSSEQMFASVFVSEKEKAEILAQVQSQVLASAPEREAQVEQLFKTKTAELASRNYLALINEFLMSSRKCAQSAASANQTIEPQQASVAPKPAISNQVLDDLRMLSGNKTSGLFNVAQGLFGINGMAPVSTPAGFAAATYALTNPEINKEKLEKRREMLLKLVDNPQLTAQLRLQLNDYAKSKSLSFDRMLNPVLPEPFDEKKHGSRRKWQVEVASKIVDFKEYLNLDQELKEQAELEELIKDTNGRARSIPAIMRLVNRIEYLIERFCKYFIATFYGKACIGLPLVQTKLTLNFVYNFIKGSLHRTIQFSLITPLFLLLYGLAFLCIFVPYLYIGNQLGDAYREFKDEIYRKIRAFCFVMGIYSKEAFFTFLCSILGIRSVNGDNIQTILLRYLFSGKLFLYILQQPFRVQISLLKFFLDKFKNGNPKQKAFLLVLVGVPTTFFVAKTLYDLPVNKNRLSAIDQLLAILDNLQNMIKCGQNCENLLYGQSIETEKCITSKELDFAKTAKKLLSRKDHKLTYLPIYRHEQTISLFQEFYKNISIGVDGKTVLPDSKVIIDCFTPMHEKIGEIDLLVSLAELVINSKDQKAEFAVAEFIHGSDRAVVSGDSVWNVLIDRKVVVPNDVEIGSGCSEGQKSIQGILVTAGNGCGKSVHIAGVSTAAWLAQCLGVAPARKLAITPFERFVTQINTVVDDPLNNKSLFRAQIRQFGQIVTEVTNGTGADKKLTFICLDESLSGTKPKYAGPLLAALIKGRLSTSNNFAMLFATHLEHLASKVENLSDGTMVPVQVACNLDKDGHFESSTYKIAPGASAVDSAFKVAQEEWIDFMPEQEVESLLEIAKAEFGNV